MFSFDSQIKIHPFKLPDFDENAIKNEPMLFSCDYKTSRKLGGPITNAFLDCLPYNILYRKDFIVDSRVHMLKPGWFPCIPGFHHDDVPRSTKNGQPNYVNPEYESKHIMCLVNGDICPTEFAIGQVELEDVKEGEVYYKVWHPIIEEKIKKGELKSVKAPSNVPILFNNHTFHQGTRAVGNGFRWFIRCSYNTNRPHLNELRRQTQVYLEHPMDGW